jgi:hypothetical protein
MEAAGGDGMNAQRAEIWYHVTPSSNRRGIEDLGLRPGHALGKVARPGFSDSLAHIFVCTDLETARWWCRRLTDGNGPQEDYVIYEIRAMGSGLALKMDPLSVNRPAQAVSGFTVDEDEVPAKFLTCIETVPIQKGYPPAGDSKARLQEARWTVSDEFHPPPSAEVWTVRGFKDAEFKRVDAETRPEAWGMIVAHARKKGLL